MEDANEKIKRALAKLDAQRNRRSASSTPTLLQQGASEQRVELNASERVILSTQVELRSERGHKRLPSPNPLAIPNAEVSSWPRPRAR